MSERTLVLGLAFAYGIDKVRVFVESLRRHYDGPAALVVTSRGPPELLDYLAAHHIDVHFFDAALWMITDIQISRYVRYYEVLRGSSVRYDRILLTDVSDVLFQAHPFAGAPEGDLLFFMEDARTLVGNSEANSMWIEDMFGPQVLAEMKADRVSCSGTTMGSHDAILRYIEKLLHFCKAPLMMKLQGKRGHDQGIHNYILRHRLVEGIRAVENGTHIFTIGRMPEAEIILSDQGILTATGAKCPIVHQYTYMKKALEWVG